MFFQAPYQSKNTRPPFLHPPWNPTSPLGAGGLGCFLVHLPSSPSGRGLSLFPINKLCMSGGPALARGQKRTTLDEHTRAHTPRRHSHSTLALRTRPSYSRPHSTPTVYAHSRTPHCTPTLTPRTLRPHSPPTLTPHTHTPHPHPTLKPHTHTPHSTPTPAPHTHTPHCTPTVYAHTRTPHSHPTPDPELIYRVD